MEILRIYINVIDTLSVNSERGTVQMILFDGYCKSGIFKGKVLPGGVDTQKYGTDGNGTLSARYMLEGVDASGTRCRLFIENEAVVEDGQILETLPRVWTDSSELKWLEESDLYGNVLSDGGGLVISIYTRGK